MTFEAILISHLQSRSAITSLIGTRIYPGHAPDAVASPYVVYFPVSITTEYCHDGEAFRTYSIQFSVFAHNYAEVCAVREALIGELSGLSGAIGTAPNTMLIHSSFHQSTLHRYEQDTALHQSIVEFEITV